MKIKEINPAVLIRPVDIATKVPDSIKAIEDMIYDLAREIQRIQQHINAMKGEMIKDGLAKKRNDKLL